MANLITLSRLPVLLIVVSMLYAANPAIRVASVFGVVILILLDTVDGIVARARHQVSLMGSVLDIMADRVVELVLWIVYADVNLIPVAIPIIYVMRGTIVDSLRSVHVSEGEAPFKAMRTGLGKWLVASPVMRTTYGVSKLISFAGLAFTHALSAYVARGSASASALQTSLLIFQITSWISVALCLVRGVPVILEALPSLESLKRL